MDETQRSDQPDKSYGYDAIAESFTRARNIRIGPPVVREWCKGLPSGATVLELGCGFGAISQVIMEAGFSLYGIDASENMIRIFKQRFPNAHAECAAAEESEYFHREFDGLVAWGLIFLLPEAAQETVIAKAAKALAPDGQLLFTATENAVKWDDGMTGLPSVSLGAERYDELLANHGLTVTGHAIDEGDNYYFFAVKK
jgi:2-polyprenyl-3-methyl-5-hydroxy-6-metoxy-1,4-benzoquinol methylase